MPYGTVIDWLEEKYKEFYNKKPQEVWRTIRKLHQECLIKVKKGIYKHNPEFEKIKILTILVPK